MLQPGQTVAVRSRSQGRLVNRYWRLVSAPTGQISVQLPWYSETAGWSLKVAMTVSLPRWTRASSCSPEISAEKRVQRQQRMHRSRSRRILSESGTALSKCFLGKS
jgi:hypothetical protein